MARRLFIFCALWFLLCTSREPPWADAHVVYDTTSSLLRHFSLSVTLGGHPWFFAIRDGHKYGVFPLGNVLAMVPSYLAYMGLAATKLFPNDPLYAFTCHLSPALLMAAAVALFYQLSQRFGASRGWGLLLSLALATCTICQVYARSPYAEALQAALMMWLVSTTFAQGDRMTTRGMLSLGAAGGALFNAKLVNVLLLPLPAAYLLVRHLRPRDLESGAPLGTPTDWRRLLSGFAAGLVSFAPFAALALWHNHLKTGSIWNSGYQMNNGLFSGDLWPAVYGFLLSTGKGAFFYSPPLVLGALGLPTAWRRRREDTALILGLCLVMLLFNAKFRIWHADYCWGPRHLVPITPLWLLLCFPWLPEAMARGHRALRRAALGLLLAAGLFVQVLGCAFYWDHYIRILIAMKDQTGAAAWFQESLSHGHYIPQFSPIRGHLWLLDHMVRRDPDLAADVPWRLIVPGKVNLASNWAALHVDWWAGDWLAQDKAPAGTRLPPRTTALLLLGLLSGGLCASALAVRRRLRASGADRSE